MKGLIVLCCVLLVGGSWGYPGGAPTEACQDMTPGHGVDPQEIPSPYTYSIEEITPDKKFEFTIIGSEVDFFEGFMVQARDRSNGLLQGTFTPVNGTIKVIDCFGADLQNCATHEKAQHYWNMTITWNAPDNNPLDNINFVYTVVKEKEEFWTNQIAPLIVSEE